MQYKTFHAPRKIPSTAMSIYALSATGVFSCTAPCVSGLTAAQREVKERRTVSSVSQHGFCLLFFSQRKWKCWTGSHLPWQMKELTTLPSATLKWMLQVTRTKSMVFIYDTRLCQPMRTCVKHCWHSCSWSVPSSAGVMGRHQLSFVALLPLHDLDISQERNWVFLALPHSLTLVHSDRA